MIPTAEAALAEAMGAVERTEDERENDCYQGWPSACRCSRCTFSYLVVQQAIERAMDAARAEVLLDVPCHWPGTPCIEQTQRDPATFCNRCRKLAEIEGRLNP